MKGNVKGGKGRGRSGGGGPYVAEGRRGKCVSEEEKIETAKKNEGDGRIRKEGSSGRGGGGGMGGWGEGRGEEDRGGGEREGERRGRLREAEGGCERENRSACPLCHPPINTLPLAANGAVRMGGNESARTERERE
jgi:hypothetical protein